MGDFLQLIESFHNEQIIFIRFVEFGVKKIAFACDKSDYKIKKNHVNDYIMLSLTF